MKVDWSLGEKKTETEAASSAWPSEPPDGLNLGLGDIWRLAVKLARLAAATGLVLVIVLVILQNRSEVGPAASLQAPSFVKRTSSPLESVDASNGAAAAGDPQSVAWAGGNGGGFASGDDKSMAISPKAFCEALSDAGFVNAGWSKSPVFKNEWECATSGTTTLKSQANGESFAIARGRDETIIGTVLLKITLGSVYQQDAASADVQKLLRLVSQGFGMEFQSETVDDIAAWKNVKAQTGSARLEFKKEFSGARRYSLSIEFAPNMVGSKAPQTP